jgi:hypothetical protein
MSMAANFNDAIREWRNGRVKRYFSDERHDARKIARPVRFA